MFEWIAAKIGSSLGAGILQGIGDVIVQPLLQAFLKSKDVDLEKFKTSETSVEHMAVAILDANVRFAQIKAGYALAVLQWWPFRLILFVTLLICTTRFCLIMIDATWWWLFGCTIDGKDVFGDACAWSIPAIKGAYGQAELEYILFFVVAKPVDTAVSGAVGLASRYLRR
jgi:hypothetical protein